MFIQSAIDFVTGAQVEIFIFVLAFVAHGIVFGHHRLGSKPVKGLKGPAEKSRSVSPPPSPSAPRAAPNAATGFCKQISGLVRSGAAPEVLARELSRALGRSAPDVRADLAAGLLSQLMGKWAPPQLVAVIRGVLKELEVQPNDRLYEALLHAYLSVGLREEFDQLLAEVKAKGGLPEVSLSALALRASTTGGDLEAALQQLPDLAEAWRVDGSSTSSVAHGKLFQHLARLAIERSALPALCQQLKRLGLVLPWTVEALLTECRSCGAEVRRVVEDLAAAEQVAYTAGAHVAMVRAAETGAEALRAFEKGFSEGAGGKRLFLAAAFSAKHHKDQPLAEAVVRCNPACPDAEVAAAVLGLCRSNGPLAGANPDASVLQLYAQSFSEVDFATLEVPAQRLVIDAALRRRDSECLQQVIASTDLEGIIRSMAAERRLEDCFALFTVCPGKTTGLYNALLDACVESGDSDAAARVMRLATETGMADVVTHNTMIKAHLHSGSTRGARSALLAMTSSGLAPNIMTFNSLIDATVREGGDVWALVTEMKAYGLRPNHVTCSIMLKGIYRASKASDLERVLALLEEMEDPVDEVLLSSVFEACIRSSCKDLLLQQLEKQKRSCSMPKGTHTYGSIIRAHGYVHDLHGVWSAWEEMTGRHVLPTSVTLGCMVEALSSNGDPEAGYRLIREFMDNPQRRGLVNAVIYCSVLKCFSHTKQFDRVWAIYEEMKEEGLQFLAPTYNALIDACSRSGDMRRIPALLEEMSRANIEPNTITYSTVIKGYCQVDCVDQAFEILREMKNTRGLHPDEITYNTLLDGCARYSKWEKGIALLGEMQDAGVSPSNFTLSVLVKLARNCKRTEKAFELTEELCAKYKIRPNVHVYNNLIHVCTASSDLDRALAMARRMLREKVRPDNRTYLLLLRGCFRVKKPMQAASLLRAAAHLPGEHPAFKDHLELAQPKGGLLMDTVSEAIEGIARCGDEALAVTLMRELRDMSGVPMDPRLPLRITAMAFRR